MGHTGHADRRLLAVLSPAMRLRLLPLLLAFGELSLVFSPSPRPLRAQTSEIEREWRALNEAQAAHTRGRDAALRGDRSQAESELAAAAALYRQLLEINPLRKDLYAPLADTLLRRGNAAAAYALCVQQVRSGVRDVPLQVQLLRSLAAMRRLRHALDEGSKLQSQSANDARLQAVLGEIAAEAGEHDLAIRMLSSAIAQAGRGLPNPPPLDTGIYVSTLRLTLARSLLAAKRPQEVPAALADLASSGNPGVLMLIGQAQLAAGQYAQSVATLQRILPQLSVDQRASVTVLISQALQRSGRMTEAIAALRQAGDHPVCMQALADIYMAEDPPNPAAAAMVLERAAQIDASNLRLCLDFAIVLNKAGKADRALAELQRCESLNLPDADALTALSLRADLQLKLGRIDEGIGSLREARLRSLQPGQAKGSTTSTANRNPTGNPTGTAPVATAYDDRLARALMQRGLGRLQKSPVPKDALTDLEEAKSLASPTLSLPAAQALALGLLAAARPADAVTLLSALCEGPQASPGAQLLAVFGRALRENGQPLQALSVMQRAEELAAGQGDATLRQAVRQDQGETLIALGRPFDALRLIEGNDEAARRQRASAFLSAVRAYYQPSQPGRGRGASRRGPFPPLRQGNEQAEARAGKTAQATYPPLRGPIDLSEVQTARGPFPPLRGGSEGQAGRGPFPPLRGASDGPEGSNGNGGPAVAAALPPQGLNDERQVLSYAQAALRAGSVLSASERAEAMLYQVVALARGGQFDLALRRLTEVGNQFDLPTLEALLGPGGFTHLKARLTLRGGDFYQGASFAQQALQQIQPAAARALQSAMAVAYTSKAIDLLDRGERGDIERANSLLRSAQSYMGATSPENQARMQYNLAVLQLHRGRAEEARLLLSRLDPQVLPTVWLGQGSYHDLIGDSRSALDFYRRYLQSTEPGDPQLPLVRQWVDVLERIYEGSR